MTMTNSQIKILNRINQNLQRGDLKVISEKTNKRPEYVSRVLNPFNPAYSETVINEAVKIVTEREQGQKKILEKLPA